MMSAVSKLSDVVAFLCAAYPAESRDDLSNARLTKLVYLADWKSTQRSGHPITEIEWVFHNYGPWVADVVQATAADARFEHSQTANAYGSPKLQLSLRQDLVDLTLRNSRTLSDADKSVIRDVIEETKSMYFGEFVEHIYRTYPVQHSKRYSALDLRSLASRQAEEGPVLSKVDFEHEGLNAVTYAQLRDRLGQAAAQYFSRMRVSRLVDNPAVIGATASTFTDPLVMSTDLAPEIGVRKVDDWDREVVGRVTLSLVGRLVEGLPSLEHVRRIDPIWDGEAPEFESLLDVTMRYTVSGNHPAQWTFLLQQIVPVGNLRAPRAG